MKTISRYIMTLALLLTAATGAWADWTGGTYTATTNEELGAITVSDDATLTINQGVTVTVNGGITVASGKTLTVTGGGALVANGANGGNGDTNQPGNAGGTAIAGNVIINGVGLTVTATGGQGGQGGKGYDGDNGFGDGAGGQGDQGGTGGNGGYAFSGEVTIYAGSVKANGGTGGQGGKGGTGGTGGDGDMFDTGAYGGNGGTGGTGGYGGYAFAGTLTVFGGNVTAYGGAGGAGGAGGDGGDGGQGDVDPGESGEPGDVGNDGGQSNAYANNVTFQTATYTMTDGTNPITDATGKNTVVITAADTTDPSDFEVTINDTKTEASFEMPQYDVTASYTIKRDISVDVTATMGDGTDGVRYRVKKAQQGDGYEPAEMDMMQVLALVAVNDGIEQKALTLNQDYFCRIYKLDEQTLQPTDDGVKLNDFDFAPGLYALKAFAKDDSDYAGETGLSNTFKLFQGYEVEVAAKEFITYYKDEPLYADTETSADAVIYTIQSVSADQATLSDAIETAPSRTPLLIFNNSDEAKTFLLIPANEEPNLALTVAPEFKGTLTGTTIAASTENVTNYALNGKAFVFVKNDLPVGANKAWLSISTGEPSARITIVFDDATKIANTNITNITNGDWYDLNGRKLNGMPTKKGIYMNNGRKVVVK